ncbi:unnamed protein product [Chilo suppressalis]|uniref:Uncharacterized protein n=1 Tax=Chilo suppressalis TaxID=168631 RepID=A0ABN8AU44_CHISP|nr:unnamed protein product [Chilo suppressalis]
MPPVNSNLLTLFALSIFAVILLVGRECRKQRIYDIRYFGVTAGYSEDSDYTSDLNYPVGQHANCSASQFRTAAHQMHTPQRSLEVSRENSYEREEYHLHGDTDPLYYNSQPRTNRIETWSQLHAQASVESAISWRTATDWQSGEEQRRPSLERQNTLYDDGMNYSYDVYSTSTHIRDHSHISQQPSYEEYFDSSSYPYQTSYLGDDSRQWDSGGHTQFFYDDNYGLTPTEYENVVNKRRSSVVQLPQIPPKQLPPSSRYSDYNEMAPYRPRPRRTTASLPATPSSTPKRGRALPVPPGSETGSLRSGRGRRLPRPPAVAVAPAPAAILPAPHTMPPTPAHTHVPYIPEPERIADENFGYGSYGYQTEYQTSTDQYQDPNYNTSYDEDGMQPFFDETPHATPPAAAQKSSWIDSETPQFTYPVTTVDDTLVSKSVPSTITSYLPQPPVSHQQDSYQDSYQQYDVQYDEQNQYQYDQQDQQYDMQQNQYQQDPYHDKQEYLLQQHTYDQQYQVDQSQQQYQYEQQQLQQRQLQQQQQQLQQQQQQQQEQLKQQQFQQQQYQQQQQNLQQQKQPAQQLQASVLTGAATLGSLMAGGAKKLGSFFGAAAAAVAPPPVSQPTASIAVTTAPTTHFGPVIAPVTPFSSTSTTTINASVPEVSPSVPVSTVTTSAPVALPRTPSLRRQESIQRPTVRRTRTLPDAPDDLPPSGYDESAYEEEYHKTEYDQSISHDRTSLDRYRDDDYVHDTIHEDVTEERRMSEEPSGMQKIASPTRNGLQKRKPSVDSYHSQAPSIIDRRISQSSFHHEEKLSVPITQEDSITDKSKVKFQDDRTTYHEVPDQTNGFHESEHYDEHADEYRDEREPFHEQETFHEEDEKFDDQEQFNEADDQYHDEDNVFHDEQRAEEDRIEFQPEQPKLTPKQWWHRAYNKVVMQLNVSNFIHFNGKKIKL